MDHALEHLGMLVRDHQDPGAGRQDRTQLGECSSPSTVQSTTKSAACNAAITAGLPSIATEAPVDLIGTGPRLGGVRSPARRGCRRSTGAPTKRARPARLGSPTPTARASSRWRSRRTTRTAVGSARPNAIRGASSGRSHTTLPSPSTSPYWPSRSWHTSTLHGSIVAPDRASW